MITAVASLRTKGMPRTECHTPRATLILVLACVQRPSTIAPAAGACYHRGMHERIHDESRSRPADRQMTQHQTRTPIRRARRWMGALVIGPLLLVGTMVLLYGCTLPASVQPAAAQAAGPETVAPAVVMAIGEPEVEIVPITETHASAVSFAESAPVAAPELAAPAAVNASMTERGEPDVAVASLAPRLGGLAGVALQAAAEQPTGLRFPTATPTVPADAAEVVQALPVSPLPTAAAVAAAPETTGAPTPIVESTLAITAALAMTVPIGPTQAEAAPAAPTSAAPIGPSTPPAELAPDGVARTANIPILMYHYVSTPPGDADIYRRDLSVTPDLFAAQLDRLQADGYTTISLYDLMANLAQGAPLPEKPVILTFDDGYRDLYENALPRLRERAWWRRSSC